VAYLPGSGKIVAAGGGGHIAVVDTTAEGVTQRFQGHNDTVRAVAVSNDGSRIVSGGLDGTVRIWDEVGGMEVGEPRRGHEGGVFSVAISSDGSSIVSGGLDGMVRLWDTASGKSVGKSLCGRGSRVHSVAFSADGSRVVSGGTDCTVRIWDAQSDGTAVAPRQEHDGRVSSLAASDTRVVSGGNDGTVRVSEAASGSAVGEPLRGPRRRGVFSGGDT
jgi:WD40 repeat protein